MTDTDGLWRVSWQVGNRRLFNEFNSEDGAFCYAAHIVDQGAVAVQIHYQPPLRWKRVHRDRFPG